MPKWEDIRLGLKRLEDTRLKIKRSDQTLNLCKEFRNAERLYYKNHYLESNKRTVKWRENNCKKPREKNFKERQEHKRDRQNSYRKNRYKIDLKFNLNSRISIIIWDSLKGNKAGRHWESLVGYTLSDLIRRLDKTMPVGYTWQDYLQGKLHIDYIIPISAFNFTRPEHIDFKRCWALNNLRLLPARENIKKGAKLKRPFQPALQI